MEERNPSKTYKDLERPVTTLGDVHPLLGSGVNRFHVCLHILFHMLLPPQWEQGLPELLLHYCEGSVGEHRGSTSQI